MLNSDNCDYIATHTPASKVFLILISITLWRHKVRLMRVVEFRNSDNIATHTQANRLMGVEF